MKMACAGAGRCILALGVSRLLVSVLSPVIMLDTFDRLVQRRLDWPGAVGVCRCGVRPLAPCGAKSICNYAAIE